MTSKKITFSLSFSAKLQDGNFIWTILGEQWWLFSPPRNFLMFCQAYLGLKGMSWITSARWRNHTVFAIAMNSSTLCWKYFRNFSICFEGEILSEQILYSMEFILSNIGFNFSLLRWYHSWSLRYIYDDTLLCLYVGGRILTIYVQSIPYTIMYIGTCLYGAYLPYWCNIWMYPLCNV